MKSSIIYFWSRGFLSPWFRCRFEVNHQTYSSVEQFVMAEKARHFKDQASLEHILATDNPKVIKYLSRQIKPFDSKSWHKIKQEIVYTGNIEKFKQNPELRTKLIETRDALLAEASPEDKYWGIGLSAKEAQKTPPNKWPGQNWQGKILMKVRKKLDH